MYLLLHQTENKFIFIFSDIQIIKYKYELNFIIGKHYPTPLPHFKKCLLYLNLHLTNYNILYLMIIKELEDKLAHEGVKPNLKKLGDSKQEEKPTAPYWFDDGKYHN